MRTIILLTLVALSSAGFLSNVMNNSATSMLNDIMNNTNLVGTVDLNHTGNDWSMMYNASLVYSDPMGMISMDLMDWNANFNVQQIENTMPMNGNGINTMFAYNGGVNTDSFGNMSEFTTNGMVGVQATFNVSSDSNNVTHVMFNEALNNNNTWTVSQSGFSASGDHMMDVTVEGTTDVMGGDMKVHGVTNMDLQASGNAMMNNMAMGGFSMDDSTTAMFDEFIQMHPNQSNPIMVGDMKFQPNMTAEGNVMFNKSVNHMAMNHNFSEDMMGTNDFQMFSSNGAMDFATGARGKYQYHGKGMHDGQQFEEDTNGVYGFFDAAGASINSDSTVDSKSTIMAGVKEWKKGWMPGMNNSEFNMETSAGFSSNTTAESSMGANNITDVDFTTNTGYGIDVSGSGMMPGMMGMMPMMNNMTSFSYHGGNMANGTVGVDEMGNVIVEDLNIHFTEMDN